MSVICLIGDRSGAGKTTLAINLAAALARKAPTVLLDADPHRAALQWCVKMQADQGLTVEDAAWDLEKLCERCYARHQHMVIDCPVSVRSSQTQAALSISDIALIPVRPVSVDLWATVNIDYAVEDARQLNPKLNGLLVMNQLAPRQRISPLTQQSLNEIDLPVTETRIRRRLAFNNSLKQGQSVLQMGAQGRAASAEIKQLIDEVLPHEQYR